MHTIEEILKDVRKDSDLCCAIENGTVPCYNKRKKRSRYCCKHVARKFKYKSFELPKKEKKVCKFIDCERLARCHDMCYRHYKNSDSSLIKPRCSIENCNRKHEAKGYCRIHYKRMRRTGDPCGSVARKKGTCYPAGWNTGLCKAKKCIVPNCEIEYTNKTRLVKGLCKKHYSRWLRHKDYNKIKPRPHGLKYKKKAI